MFSVSIKKKKENVWNGIIVDYTAFVLLTMFLLRLALITIMIA